jgi:hypothetical protein
MHTARMNEGHAIVTVAIDMVWLPPLSTADITQFSSSSVTMNIKSVGIWHVDYFHHIYYHRPYSTVCVNVFQQFQCVSKKDARPKRAEFIWIQGEYRNSPLTSVHKLLWTVCLVTILTCVPWRIARSMQSPVGRRSVKFNSIAYCQPKGLARNWKGN